MSRVRTPLRPSWMSEQVEPVRLQLPPAALTAVQWAGPSPAVRPAPSGSLHPQSPAPRRLSSHVVPPPLAVCSTLWALGPGGSSACSTTSRTRETHSAGVLAPRACPRTRVSGLDLCVDVGQSTQPSSRLLNCPGISYPSPLSIERPPESGQVGSCPKWK